MKYQKRLWRPVKQKVHDWEKTTPVFIKPGGYADSELSGWKGFYDHPSGAALKGPVDPLPGRAFEKSVPLLRAPSVTGKDPPSFSWIKN